MTISKTTEGRKFCSARTRAAASARLDIPLEHLKDVERMNLRDAVITPDQCRYLTDLEIVEVLMGDD